MLSVANKCRTLRWPRSLRFGRGGLAFFLPRRRVTRNANPGEASNLIRTKRLELSLSKFQDFLH